MKRHRIKSELPVKEPYPIYWLRHQLVQAEAKGDTREMARLQKQLEELTKE